MFIYGYISELFQFYNRVYKMLVVLNDFRNWPNPSLFATHENTTDVLLLLWEINQK